jgi:DNA-directed RNA polymerase subunit RPC12/RpoP
MEIESSEIRCKECGTWNKTKIQNPVCENCGKELRPVSEQEKENIEQRMHAWEINIPIHDHDSGFVSFCKNTFNAVQWVFFAILSFFIWLFALGPG